MQPSEFVKPAFAVIGAWLFSEAMQNKGVFARSMATGLMTLIVVGLLLGLWLGTLLFSGQEIAVLLTGLAALGFSLAGLKLLDGKLGLKSRWQPRLVSVTPAGPETPGMDAGSPAID